MLTRQECFNLIDKYGLSFETIKHLEVVNKVAMYLAEKLKEKGEDVNLDLVEGASLLHDIGISDKKRKKQNSSKIDKIEKFIYFADFADFYD